ncbi:MAG: IS21 family transposase [Coriobacteriales bacterium]|nr:IS21 family transposase [Coriobacteriales bacterium]
MAKRIRAKLVLELLEKGMTGREIRSTRHISQRSVKLVREAAERAGVTYGDVADLPDQEVYDLLFPAQKVAREAYAEPDWELVHSELQRDGVTLKLLWEEHCDDAGQRGLVAKSYNTFCRGYKSWVTARGVTNHLEHKPGQVMEVDWSGTPMWLAGAEGEAVKCHLFVATLPYSQYSYVEATRDMRQGTWLLCHVHAWDFFGGVAVRTVCDNLRTGVISHPRGGEVVLNEAYEALGAHYVTAIMPTGVRKPKQKASVEGTCGKVATAIVARLRNRAFATLADLNAAILEALGAFNSAPFQKREGSRREVFEDVERAFLAPLPKVPFEVCQWVYGRKVAPNFHVAFERNQYSVPHAYVGQKADLRVSDSAVEVWVAGERVATHPRFKPYERWQYRTDPAHMPPQFAKVEWDDRRLLRWAREVGPSTHLVVSRIFEDVQIMEQGYNPALAVLNLSKRYGNEALEAACGYALERAEHPRCRFIRSVLASGAAGPADRGEDEPGGYIRGEGYYGGGDQ